MADTGFSLLPAHTHTHTFSDFFCHLLSPDLHHLLSLSVRVSTLVSLPLTNLLCFFSHAHKHRQWARGMSVSPLTWWQKQTRRKKNLQGGKFRGRRELKTERKGGVKGGSRKVTRGYFWFPLENPQTHTRVLAESRWDAENIPSSSFPSSPLLTCLHRLHLFSLHCMFAGGCVCVWMVLHLR